MMRVFCMVLSTRDEDIRSLPSIRHDQQAAVIGYRGNQLDEAILLFLARLVHDHWLILSQNDTVGCSVDGPGLSRVAGVIGEDAS